VHFPVAIGVQRLALTLARNPRCAGAIVHGCRCERFTMKYRLYLLRFVAGTTAG
jgi:hypothetical protein